jgi:LuxR family maltose regulon positive regulatory protein
MAMTMQGKAITTVEEKLQFAEAALQAMEPDDLTRDIEGQIASIRAMSAIPQFNVPEMMIQAHRALELLHPANLSVRAAATWTLGLAYQYQGNNAAAVETYNEAMAISEATGNIMFAIATATTLAQLYEADNRLKLAVETYEHARQKAGDPPGPAAAETYHGLARIFYEWDDLDAAQQLAEQALHLGRQLETVDTPANCLSLLARIQLALGDTAAAVVLLAEAERFLHERDLTNQTGNVAAVQVLTMLRQNRLEAADDLAKKHGLTLSKARVLLAQGEPSAALALLEPLRGQAEESDQAQTLLKILVLQALALRANDEGETAVQVLSNALALAEPSGFIRTFVDEGPQMARLLLEVRSSSVVPDYVRELLTAFAAISPESAPAADPTSDIRHPTSDIVEPLSDRELEVLQLIAEGLTNQDIADRLYLSLYTVKAHARNIYAKLDVKNRTQAVAKAKALGLLSSS